MGDYFNKLELGNETNDQNTTIINAKQEENYFSDLESLPKFILQGIGMISNDIIIVGDRVGKVRFISKSVKSMLGYEVSDMLGTAWNETLLVEDVTYIRKNFSKKINKHQSFNINIRNLHGKYIWFDCTIVKVKSDNNSFYYIATLKDITNKKEAEEMMVRSEKMSVAGQLAAGIAHEIRNPLTSMKGFLQLLQAGVERNEAYYKIMIDEINKIETITSELLFISKPLTDNKKKELVDQMVEDVVVLLRPQARLKNIDLKWEPTSNHSIYCDRSQIKQVLINLIKNAIEAMKESGTIKIELHETDAHIEINVVDEGPGIPEEIIHKLGEPFFTTKQSGTGLGLMITKQILAHHDGNMEVFQNKEKGSTFQIQLPRDE